MFMLYDTDLAMTQFYHSLFNMSLQFSSVQAACEQQVLSSLSCDSCLEVYFITSALGIRSLASVALTIATWNFENLAMTPQFQQLTLNGMSSDSLVLFTYTAYATIFLCHLHS